MPFNCDICTKEYSTKSNLSKHQSKNKCFTNVNLNCDVCNKTFSNNNNLKRHKIKNTCSITCLHCNTTFRTLHVCPIVTSQRNIELEKENVLLKERCENMSQRLKELEYDNERYIKQIIDLQNNVQQEMRKLSRTVKKAVKQKPTTTIINVNNNFKIENLQVLDLNDFSQYASQLTIDHIKKGAAGYAEFALKYPLNNKIVCTDFARRTIKYKSQENQLANDYNLSIIGAHLFRSINMHNKKQILDYITSIEDTDRNITDTRVEFTDYVDLVRDGSQGIKHKLFPEFVKEICVLSNT